MLTPIEWMVFGLVASGSFLLAIVWQRQRATSAETGDVVGLQWLPELERTAQRGAGEGNSTEQFDVWLHRVLSQADIGLSVGVFLLASSLAAVLAGVGVALLGLAELWQILAALMIMAACVLFAWGMFRRQRRKFNEQLPIALELMSRAVQAGESFSDAVAVARDSSQTPMKTELDRCVRKMELGIAPSHAIASLAQRVPTVDVRIFAHTIAVHQQMGGRLATTLQRLATVIRERSEYTEKLRSATSLGRFAAIMICVIGLMALAYMVLCQPDYLGRLFESDLGQRMVIYAAVSEVVGIVWVFITLNSDL